MSRDAVRWQGAPTKRAFARKEKQRRQRAAAWFNRGRSAITQMVSAAKAENPAPA
ncbi:hypothetical protein GCM10027046_06730 [Uliginosibacterium flavum]